MKKILHAIVKGIYKMFALITYRPKIIGKENIPDYGAAIICPNHVHALDSTIIISNTKRRINTLAKEELFKNRFFRWIATLFGIYPVKINSKSMESVKISLKLLKNNELLMIFPEGTRNGLAKGVKPKDGAIKIAIKAKVPIIPVGIIGEFKPFKKVFIKFGKPIDFSKYESEINNKEVLENLTNNLMNEIIKLRDKKI